jgi:hypothetical protein
MNRNRVLALRLIAIVVIAAIAILFAAALPVDAATCTPSWELGLTATKSVVRTGHTVRWIAVVSTAPDGCPLTDVNVSVTPPDGVVQQIATNATVAGNGGSKRFRTSPYVAHGPGTMTASATGSGLAGGNPAGGTAEYQVEVKP